MTSFAQNAIVRANEEIRRGQPAKAEGIIRQVLTSEPNNFPANLLLGSLMLDIGKFDLAKRFLDKALEIEPGHLAALFRLGITEFSLGAFDRAEICFRAILEQDTEHYRAHLHLANVLSVRYRYDEAVDQYRRVIQLQPKSLQAWTGLGREYQHMGRMDEAVECFEKALDIDPNFTATHLHLAMSDYFLTKPDEVRKMEELYSKGALSDNQHSNLAFALARTFDGQKKFDKAFQYYSLGNRERRYAKRFSIELEENSFEKLERTMNREYLERYSISKERKPTPIFIVGMLRSGTSLIEQILSSHPDVHGGGELLILPNLCEPLISVLSRVEAEDYRDLGIHYLLQLKRISDSATFITDKLPHNFKFIGFIKMALPEAKIIHCQRNALDNCVSIFRNNFFLNDGPFNDLRKLGKYYRLYENLMAHWRCVAPESIHEVAYEDLVSDTESEVRNLLTYCGLPFDLACLEFYKNPRPVSTVSHLQIRRPIYRDSVASWKRYEQHLNPLKEALGYPEKT